MDIGFQEKTKGNVAALVGLYIGSEEKYQKVELENKGGSDEKYQEAELENKGGSGILKHLLNYFVPEVEYVYKYLRMRKLVEVDKEFEERRVKYRRELEERRIRYRRKLEEELAAELKLREQGEYMEDFIEVKYMAARLLLGLSVREELMVLELLAATGSRGVEEVSILEQWAVVRGWRLPAGQLDSINMERLTIKSNAEASLLNKLFGNDVGMVEFSVVFRLQGLQRMMK